MSNELINVDTRSSSGEASPDELRAKFRVSTFVLTSYTKEPHPAFADANALLPASGEGLQVESTRTASNRELL
jgi:hypothetical protein